MIGKKIILTGSFGVGKTSLFNRFINNQFDDRYLTTIGVKVNKKSVLVGEQEVSLLLWDVAGEITQDKVPTSYFLGAAGVLYVFDLSRPITYQNIATDLEYLQSLLPYAVVRIVGNKKDLLTEAQIAEAAAKMSPPWDALTSAKTGENVEQLFQQLAADLI
ncbi:MAG: Rab family GTPase [Saprospiraceae bacterium]